MEMQKTWPAECIWQMSPSTKCGQSGSEGHKLAFICGYGSTQHSSCQYLRTTRLDAHHRRHLGRSSVSAGHTASQTMHSTDELNPAPLVSPSGLLDGACPPNATRRTSSARHTMPTWKTPAPPSSEDAPVVRCRQH